MSQHRDELTKLIRSAISRVTDAKAPESVLEAIEKTHELVPRLTGYVIVDKARWERVRAAAQLANCYRCFEPGDLDEIE